MEFTQEEKDWLKQLLNQLQFKVKAADQMIIAKSVMDKLDKAGENTPETP